MRLTPAILARAERRITLTLAEARRLPDLLGRICPAMLQYHGYYAVTQGGIRTLYIRQEDHHATDANR